MATSARHLQLDDESRARAFTLPPRTAMALHDPACPLATAALDDPATVTVTAFTQ